MCERHTRHALLMRLPLAMLALMLALLLAMGCDLDGASQRAPGSDDFEFIVVGAGAGGGPLAARLAKAGRRVLLLEAGADVGGKLTYQVPALHARATEDPDLAWWYFVRHHRDGSVDSTDSKHTPEGILYPRGSGLGGSTAVNAMVTILPSPSDWNRIATITGDASWRAQRMHAYYDRVRQWLSVEIPDPALAIGDRQVSSYLASAAATYADESRPGGSASSDPLALLGVGGELSRLLSQDINASLRDGETTGLFRIPLATKDGKRNGPRELILETVAAGHPLTVRTHSFVTRVLFDDGAAVPTAIGVEVKTGGHLYAATLSKQQAPGGTAKYYASREVILSAGAFNTPQLLMLSGIGPREQLQKHGIAERLALAGVGENLQDRYEAAVVSQLGGPLGIVEQCTLAGATTSAPQSNEDPCLSRWQHGRQGVYRTSGFLATVLRRSSPDLPLADLQVFAVPGDARGYYPGYSRDALVRKDRFSWLLLKAHTQNRDGYVRLRSASPFVRPEINFNYFDEKDPLGDADMRAMVAGVKFVRRIEARMQKDFPDLAPTEVWPGDDTRDDAAVARWVRRETWGHHACCTNKMGADDDARAVLDARFRVRGARRLRVVDASVFPEIPGTFIALPIFMVSEKAADVILEDNR
ncbi:MAG: GMC family oxidoreductase N-terminal domain-containing protein [Myxococcales bacterium]|nr:GMC family oxidoreductase N-terminal domain-containing protein [Myxococcales bacterium]